MKTYRDSKKSLGGETWKLSSKSKPLKEVSKEV